MEMLERVYQELTQVYDDLKEGRHETASRGLRAALGLARTHEVDLAGLCPATLSTVLGHALAADIEPEFARQLLWRNRMPDVGSRPGSRISIRALGVFAVVHDGNSGPQPLLCQTKPETLLKVIVAHGSRGVCVDTVCDTLWPDDDGDRAYQNFKITLYRLRRVIGRDAVRLGRRKLSLDETVCDLDIWRLEALIERIDQLVRRQPVDPTASVEAANSLMRIYGGDFLADTPSAGWAVPLRERLRRRVLSRLLSLARILEDCHRGEDAVRIYRAYLDIDDLAEVAYQRLILCLLRLERHADALAVFRRCSDVLQRVLQVAPSPALCDTVAQVRGGGDPRLRLISGGDGRRGNPSSRSDA